MREYILVVFFALSIISSNSLLAELPEVSPHTDFQPIPLSHFNRLVESIASEEVFALADVPGRPIVKGQIWKDWGANVIKIAGDIHTLHLRFTDMRKVPKKEDESRAPSFDLDVVFEDEEFIEDRMAMFSTRLRSQPKNKDSYRVVLRHSRASNPKEANGIRISVNEKQENRIFYNGIDETGVAIFIPKVPRNGFGGRALMVCPRSYDVWRVKSGFRKLELSDYELSAVAFEASGVVQGKVGSGMGPGYAKATIQTSSNISPTRYPVDVSDSNYPYVSVSYRPSGSVEPVAVAGQKQVNAGIRMGLVHNNSFAHKTESIANVVVGVRSTSIKAPLKFQYAGKPFSIEPGSCLSILKEIRLDQVHSKEQLPKKLSDSHSNDEAGEQEVPGEHLFNEHDGLDIESRSSDSPLDMLLED